MRAAETPTWRVLLIGGNSGSGKTTVARQLGLHFGVPWAQVDDFRLVMQRITTPTDQPALHFFVATGRVWELPAERLCAGLIGVAEVVSDALRVVLGHHVGTSHPLILEGDGLTPAMAAEHVYADAETRGHVRAVFLYEEDEMVVFRSLLGRGRAFQYRGHAEQRRQVQASRLYGQWLPDPQRTAPEVLAVPRNAVAGFLRDAGRAKAAAAVRYKRLLSGRCTTTAWTDANAQPNDRTRPTKQLDVPPGAA